jgi:hypothetical protein
VTRTDLQTLAEKRIKEAGILLAAGEFDGAYYLAGYGMECALKACILKRLANYWPEDKKFIEKCYTHDLKILLQHADLEGEMNAAGAVLLRWLEVKDWTEQSRYQVGKTGPDVRRFYQAIVDPAEGVLQWLRTRW